MSKKPITDAYVEWYRQEQLNRSGCGGPFLAACSLVGFIFYLIIR